MPEQISVSEHSIVAVEHETGSVCAGESTTLGPEGAGDPASPMEKVAEREADR